MLADWLDTPQGRYAMDWEREQFESAVEDVFGFNAMQVGLPSVDFLRGNRIPFKFTSDLEEGSTLTADPLQLPLATHSMDLIVLPHVLEFSPHPHQLLREAERALRPEGHLVISGFNTLSLWGLRQALMTRERRRALGCPWDARFIGLLRLKDWLQLLGFELNGGKFGCYAPPVSTQKWLSRFDFMEKAGARWWPIAGGVYVIRAVKRTAGLRLVTPGWRKERRQRRALAPVAQSSRLPVGGASQCSTSRSATGDTENV
jgi:SAM-dependent methyltransferase